MAKLTLACCTNQLSFGLQSVTHCEIELLTQGQFKNSSWNLARILELFKKACTWTVQEHKLRTVQQLLKNFWCTGIFHKLFLNILMTFLECCVDWCSWAVLKCVFDYFTNHLWTYYILELFLNLFLITSKTFLEYNVFLNCSYICSWLFQWPFMNIICS